MKQPTQASSRRYRFTGSAETGVPGLPHEITLAEAETLCVLDILNAAIANGNYVEVMPAIAERQEVRDG